MRRSYIMYNTISRNVTSGSRSLVDYLNKESISKEFVRYLDKENINGENAFFNSNKSDIDVDTVVSSIDNNCRGLSHDEARFYSITFDPSKKELDHLSAMADRVVNSLVKINAPGTIVEMKDRIMKNMLAEYTVKAMDLYAENFNREGIDNSNDLVWFGKVEKDRYWKESSRTYGKSIKHNERVYKQILRLEKKLQTQEVKEQIAILKNSLVLESQLVNNGRDIPVRNMMPKMGVNYHVHVIVSRRDKEQKMKLSPLSKARFNDAHLINGKKCQIGFDRDKFSNKLEQSFDELFAYHREFRDSYEGRKVIKLYPNEYIEKKLAWEKERGVSHQQERGDKIESQISRYTVNRVVAKAGLEYINDGIKPYRNVMNTGIRGVKILKRANSYSQQQAMKYIGEVAGAFVKEISGNLLSKSNPYIAVANIIAKGITALSLRSHACGQKR